jgi:hypothetical protein
MTYTPAPPRRAPTPQEIQAEQRRDAERATAQRMRQQQQPTTPPTTLPVAQPPTSTAVAAPDNRTNRQRYLDEISPIAIAGRLIRFDVKRGVFATVDDGERVDPTAILAALCDQTQAGWIRFRGEGEPPDKLMGLFYDPDFQMPPRESLGDTDPAAWETGLSGSPADPWLHQINVVLQHTATDELYTFSTSSITGSEICSDILIAWNARTPMRTRWST